MGSRTASAVSSILGSVHAANYIGIEWPCGRYVVRRVSGRCGGRLGSSTASLRSGAGNWPVSVAACLPNASVLGVAQLRVGSGIQQRNWSLSRCTAASSPASCRRMGGFPGPKRSLVVAIKSPSSLIRSNATRVALGRRRALYASSRRASACSWS